MNFGNLDMRLRQFVRGAPGELLGFSPILGDIFGGIVTVSHIEAVFVDLSQSGFKNVLAPVIA